MDRIAGRVEVATCIACGARSHFAECPDGCSDVALEVVEAEAVDKLARRLASLEARVAGLRDVGERLAAASGGEPWEALVDAARAALRTPVPAAVGEPEVVPAWGCPVCGRIDAPQPCLGVCIRVPVAMVDAGEYRGVRSALDRAEHADRELSALVSVAAHVRARPGREEETRAAMRSRARAALDRA